MKRGNVKYGLGGFGICKSLLKKKNKESILEILASAVVLHAEGKRKERKSTKSVT
jgi:hypothetical protein